MPKIEEILELALSELRNGTSIDALISRWPEHKDELKEYLSIAKNLSSIPKKNVPKPAMQRKYLSVPIKQHFWFAWLHFTRFTAASMAALLLIAGFATTAYGAMKSLPGQTLFPVKKTAEKIQLHFASNDIERANLQLKITKERIADAQTIFSSEKTTPDQKLAALTELTDQTDATLKSVKSAANSSNQTPSPIAESLQDITHQQQALLNKIDSQNKVANNDNSNSAVKQFRQMVAATNEQASIISLKPDPNTVIVSGIVSLIKPDSIIVDKIEILTSTSTVYKLEQGLATTSKALLEDQQVLVISEKRPSTTTLTAKEILITTLSGQVQGISTTTPSSLNTSTSSTSTLPSTKIIKPTTSTSSVISFPLPATQNDQAVGTFIPEDPTPQYNP